MSNDQDIFSDKIKLSSLIIEKEFNLINTFHNVIRECKINDVKGHDIIQLPDYHVCIQNCAELYDFLKYTYIEKLEEEEANKIRELIYTYEIGGKLNIKQLQELKDLILKVCAISKFHEVSLKGDSDSILDEW